MRKKAILRHNPRLREEKNPDHVCNLFITPNLTPSEQKTLRLQLIQMNKGAKKFRRIDSAMKVSMSTSCCTDNVILNDSKQTPNPLSNNSSNS